MKDAADFELDQDEDTNVRLKFDNPGSEMTWLVRKLPKLVHRSWRRRCKEKAILSFIVNGSINLSSFKINKLGHFNKQISIKVVFP